jgi:hypothetical protein
VRGKRDGESGSRPALADKGERKEALLEASVFPDIGVAELNLTRDKSNWARARLCVDLRTETATIFAVG